MVLGLRSAMERTIQTEELRFVRQCLPKIAGTQSGPKVMVGLFIAYIRVCGSLVVVCSSKARQALAQCEKSPEDAAQLNYDARNPFDICS